MVIINNISLSLRNAHYTMKWWKGKPKGEKPKVLAKPKDLRRTFTTDQTINPFISAVKATKQMLAGNAFPNVEKEEAAYREAFEARKADLNVDTSSVSVKKTEGKPKNAKKNQVETTNLARYLAEDPLLIEINQYLTKGEETLEQVGEIRDGVKELKTYRYFTKPDPKINRRDVFIYDLISNNDARQIMPARAARGDLAALALTALQAEVAQKYSRTKRVDKQTKATLIKLMRIGLETATLLDKKEAPPEEVLEIMRYYAKSLHLFGNPFLGKYKKQEKLGHDLTRIEEEKERQLALTESSKED